MSDLETREAVLEFRADADADEGVIEGYAVPYGEVANIGGKYSERFERGAFDGSDDIKLYRDHKTIIGHVLETEDREQGLWVRARIALSDLGRDTLALLRSGSLNRFSVGFIPIENRTDDAGVVVRLKAALREISVVERPAYGGATILAVREESITSKETEMTDLVNADVAELRTAIEDIDRKVETLNVMARAEEAPAVDDRSAGELIKRAVEGDESAVETLNRAYEGGVQADGVNKPAGLVNLIRIYDASSGVLSQVFSTGTLPSTGNTLEFVELDTNTLSVTEQVNEGDDIPMGKVSFKTRTVPVKTYAGGAELSRQAIERSTVGVLNTTLDGLALEAGKRKKLVLRAAFNQVVAARSAVASNGGVVVLGATLAASTAGHWEDALIDAAITYDGIALAPEALVVSATVFKKLRSLTVSGERVFTVAEKNASGTLNLMGLTGNLAGIPVYLDPSQTGDSAVFVNGRAIRQYDSPLISLSDDKITNLTKQFAVYRYGAVADEIPSGIVPVKLAAS